MRRRKKFVTFLLFIAAGFALNCSRENTHLGPSILQSAEEELFQIAATLIADDAIPAFRKVDGLEGKTVVLDSNFLSTIKPEFGVLVKRELSSRKVIWMELDLQGKFVNLPGKLEPIGNGISINHTHVLLGFGIEGEGVVRTVSWMYTCGSLCGSGQSVEFTLKNNIWEKGIFAYRRF